MAEDVYEIDEAFDELTLECSARLTQMTKTYNDIEAVTKLLEEKEKDLELAAKIGKSLLERNKELQQTNEFLEEQLNVSNEQVTQLKHELQQKIDLLHVFTDSEVDSGGSTPSGDRFLNWGTLQKKLKILEDENVSLKLEAGHLKSLTQGLEEKEQQLVNDCVRQLADANSQIEDLSFELAEKNEEYSAQQREISHLLKELVDKQNSEKRLNYENEELTAQIQAAQETQLELTQELMDLQERYAEVVALLAETREELKGMKEKLSTLGRSTSSHPDSMYDSLASEIEASDSSFGSFSPFSSAAKTKAYCSISNSSANDRTAGDGNNLLNFVESTLGNNKSSITTPTVDNERFYSGAGLRLTVDVNYDKAISEDESLTTDRSFSSTGCNPKNQIEQIDNMLFSNIKHIPSTESLVSYPAPGLGVPGIPGSKDLEFAIKRLSLRRRVELECQKYRRSKIGGVFGAAYSLYCNNNVVGDNLRSFNTVNTVSSSSEASTPTATSSYKSSKTLLMKPLEGSVTLNQWKDLATPSLVGALEKRSGIKVKGGSPPTAAVLTEESQIRRMTPAEYSSKPSCDSGIHSDVDTSSVSIVTTSSVSNLELSACCRQPIITPGTYTYVTSRVLHPSERSIYSSSSSSTETVDAEQQREGVGLDSSDDDSVDLRSGGTSTFSTAYGLASALKERCVDLVSSSWWLHPYRSSPMAIDGGGASSAAAAAAATATATAVTKTTRPLLVNTQSAKIRKSQITESSGAQTSGGLTSLLASKNSSDKTVRSPLDIPQPGDPPPGVITRSTLIRRKTVEEPID